MIPNFGVVLRGAMADLCLQCDILQESQVSQLAGNRATPCTEKGLLLLANLK
jgi:hypothetical protein